MGDSTELTAQRFRGHLGRQRQDAIGAPGPEGLPHRPGQIDPLTVIVGGGRADPLFDVVADAVGHRTGQAGGEITHGPGGAAPLAHGLPQAGLDGRRQAHDPSVVRAEELVEPELAAAVLAQAVQDLVLLVGQRPAQATSEVVGQDGHRIGFLLLGWGLDGVHRGRERGLGGDVLVLTRAQAVEEREDQGLVLPGDLLGGRGRRLVGPGDLVGALDRLVRLLLDRFGCDCPVAVALGIGPDIRLGLAFGGRLAAAGPSASSPSTGPRTRISSKAATVASTSTRGGTASGSSSSSPASTAAAANRSAATRSAAVGGSRIGRPATRAAVISASMACRSSGVTSSSSGPSRRPARSAAAWADGTATPSSWVASWTV